MTRAFENKDANPHQHQQAALAHAVHPGHAGAASAQREELGADLRRRRLEEGDEPEGACKNIVMRILTLGWYPR